jgi:hypothetical protein
VLHQYPHLWIATPNYTQNVQTFPHVGNIQHTGRQTVEIYPQVELSSDKTVESTWKIVEKLVKLVG